MPERQTGTVKWFDSATGYVLSNVKQEKTCLFFSIQSLVKVVATWQTVKSLNLPKPRARKALKRKMSYPYSLLY